ncbi:hypothetical protein GCM10028857_09450 [Salinarchaeum chitinilyticum]
MDRDGSTAGGDEPGAKSTAYGDGDGDDATTGFEGDGGYGNEATDSGESSSATTELSGRSESGQSRSIDVTVEDGGERTGVTPDERAALERVDAFSKLLDEAVRVPGTDVQFGLDPVLGVLPGGGDAVAAALSLYPIVEAYRLDAPRSTIAKMLSLVAVDAILGSVPVLGVLFDAYWKANVWNARALERHVDGS